MTPKELIEQEAERVFGNRPTDMSKIIGREAFISGATFALSLPRWIKIEEGCEMPGVELGVASFDVLITDGKLCSVGYYDYLRKGWVVYGNDILVPTHYQIIAPPPTP